MTNVGGLANVTGGSLPAATFGSIHSALRAHPLAVDDQSDAWVRAVEMRDPLALGSADAAPPQTTELPPPPIIGDGAGGNCPRTHPVGIDVNGDGLAEVCYETTFVAGQTCPTGTTLKQQAAPDNIDSDADLHACLPD